MCDWFGIVCCLFVDDNGEDLLQIIIVDIIVIIIINLSLKITNGLCVCLVFVYFLFFSSSSSGLFILTTNITNNNISLNRILLSYDDQTQKTLSSKSLASSLLLANWKWMICFLRELKNTKTKFVFWFCDCRFRCCC
mgnify:CR=1 FL=1